MRAGRRRHGLVAAVIALLGAAPSLAAAAPSAAAAPQPRYALVIGHNGSDDPELAPLRYADDDAIRYAELLRWAADEVVLLVSRDASSRRLYPHVADAPPTRRAVLDALAHLLDNIAADRAAGRDPVLYFVYSGHGQTEQDGTGYVHLADGHFTTRDLYHELLEPLDGALAVLIIDACNAAVLVHTRGGSRPERRRATARPLRLESYPRVGVVLSSSGPGEVHEWGRYLSGVFSHEVRSALVGPGDLDGDGRVSFAELAAFVAAANQTIANPEVRLNPYIRPPLDQPGLPVFDLAQARFPARLVLQPDRAGHGYVVDGALVRYADFHPAAGARIEIALTRDDQEWTVVHSDREWVIPAGARGQVHVAELPSTPRTTLGSRGAVGDYLAKHLFQQPIDLDFAKRYLERDYLSDLVVERAFVPPWYESSLGWSLVGGGLAAAGGGLGFHLSALGARDRALGAGSAEDRQSANDRIRRHRTTAGALYGVGAAALISGALVLALHRPLEYERFSPPLAVDVGPSGIVIRGHFGAAAP